MVFVNQNAVNKGHQHTAVQFFDVFILLEKRYPVPFGRAGCHRLLHFFFDPQKCLLFVLNDFGVAAAELEVFRFITKPLFRSELVDLFEKINDFSEAVYEPEAAKGEVQFAGERILLVEDNELNMEIAEFLLQNEGAQVTKAWNGQEAVEVFKKSEPGEFDVILMDIMMPVMNGYEAAKMIRSLDRKDAKVVPIIAMTANAFTEDRLRAKEAGMDEHIAKPVDVKLLVKVISRLVENSFGGIRNEKEKME